MRAPSVLFVCLGNICRSPLAEGAMRAAAEDRGIDVTIESAGTSDWHVGSEPDRRAQAIAARNGINISRQRARQVRPDDFHRFDHIIAMDAENLAHLQGITPEGARARLSLMLDDVPGRAGQPVTDPYFGDSAGFEGTWQDVILGVEALLDRLPRVARANLYITRRAPYLCRSWPPRLTPITRSSRKTGARASTISSKATSRLASS